MASNLFSTILHSLADAVFPPLCEVCARPLTDGEQLMCLHCRHALPRTYTHRETTSEMHRRLLSTGLPVDRTASYFHYFSDNEYGSLIKRGKYNGRPDIVRQLAEDFASELVADAFFDGIDVLLPMPLYGRKLMRRGYNQSEVICQGLSAVTGIPIADNLKARRHSTQTRKSADERYINVRDSFYLTNADELAGMHILLVDDIITTGATIRAALTAIHATVPSTTTSVLTLGQTKLR